MIAHTSGSRTALRTSGRQLKTEITYTIGETTTTLTDANLNSVNAGFNTELYKTTMQFLEIDSNTAIPKNTMVNVSVYVLVGSTYEKNYNHNFIITEEPLYLADTNSYKIIGYDAMILSMVKYDDNVPTLTYPTTVDGFLDALLTKLYTTNYTLPDTYPNYDTAISQDYFLGLNLTCREVLDEMCLITASNLIVDTNGAIIMKTPTTTSEYITSEDLRDINVDFGVKYGPINSLVLSRSAESDNIFRSDGTSITENGLTELKIKEGQILASEDREDFIDDMFTAIDGTEYYKFDIETVGLLIFEPLDIVTITYNSIDYPTVFLNNSISITQGLSENAYADGLELTTTDYSTAGVTDGDIKRAILTVNKQEATITSTVETVTSLSTSVTNLEEVTGTNEEAITTLQTNLVNDYTTTDELQEELDTRDNNIIETLQTEITQSADALEISILNNINTNGVSKLTNTLVTIDIDGIKVAVNTSAFNTLLNNVGLYCKDGSTIVAQFDKDGGLIKNLIVQGSITFPSITLIEYTDADSELGLGHFWNGA